MIPNYNGRQMLESCLAATLPQAQKAGAEVIVVDNGSADDSVSFVHQAFPEAIVVENATNEGFAGGCNAGGRRARSDRIVLLNNDAVPEPDWLTCLLRAVEPQDVAVACSVIDEAHYAGDYEMGTGSISVVGHPIPNVARDPAEPFYATGCSLVFKRDVLGEPFFPVFFAYYEDTLLSWRARLRGYRVVRALDSRVRHEGSATASKLSSRAFYWERNKLLVLLLCYEAGTLVRLLPLYAFDGIARIARDIWLTLKAPGALVSNVKSQIRRYLSVWRALGWLATHRDEISRLRREVQSERIVADGTITPMLSGKIFDDRRPTRGQGLANALSVAYCRLAGIATAEARAENYPALRSQLPAGRSER